MVSGASNVTKNALFQKVVLTEDVIWIVKKSPVPDAKRDSGENSAMVNVMYLKLVLQ